MTGKPESTDILKSFVDQLQFNFVATDIITNPDGTYTLETENTYLLQPLYKIIIDGVQYTIDEVVHNESIKIHVTDGAPVVPGSNTFVTYKPGFRHGRAMEVNNEMSFILDAFQKLPLVYMMEPFEDHFFERDNPLDREITARLFFLTQANFSDFTIEQHHEQCIKPMRNLIYGFISLLKMIGKVGKFTDYTIKDHVKFGVIQSDTLKSSKLLGDDMSGCELIITIPIRKFQNCQQFSLSPLCLPGRIVDQEGNLIQFLFSNEEYPVTIFDSIMDSIDENETTITDDILD